MITEVNIKNHVPAQYLYYALRFEPLQYITNLHIEQPFAQIGPASAPFVYRLGRQPFTL